MHECGGLAPAKNRVYWSVMTFYIIGLGNPDKEYEHTRHNVGFKFLDFLAKKLDCGSFAMDKHLNALVAGGKVNSTRVVLVKPLEFVNRTGNVVAKIKRSTKVKPEQIILVHDDLDIPLGHAKQSYGKSSGGHKGVQSVIRALKTKDFWRIRIGTATTSLKKARAQSDKKRDSFVIDFVLSPFTKKEQETLKTAIKEGYQKILSLL